jgi:hypothetical protein
MDTIESLDAALAKIPTQPTNDADFDARANLMARRCELDQAARAAASRSQPRPRGNLEVNVPPSIGCTQFISERGRECVARVADDGRIVLDLFAGEFKSLLAGNAGLTWQKYNEDLMLALGQP